MGNGTSDGIPVLDISYIADEPLDRYSVVVYGPERQHCKGPAADLDNQICGVVQQKAEASGDVVRVRKMGISQVIAGEAITKALEVAIDYVDATTDGGRVKDPVVWASGDAVVGVPEEAAAASGDLIECWLRIHSKLG